MKVPKPLVYGSSVAAGVALGRRLAPSHPLVGAAVGALVGLFVGSKAAEALEDDRPAPVKSPTHERPFGD